MEKTEEDLLSGCNWQLVDAIWLWFSGFITKLNGGLEHIPYPPPLFKDRIMVAMLPFELIGKSGGRQPSAVD